jgi:hypothetical protein
LATENAEEISSVDISNVLSVFCMLKLHVVIG